MAMPPLLKRRAAEAASQPSADANELLARTRARRRLMGAAVLLVAGVIAFPLLFETQPRPVPVDIPMVIPSRESAAPLAPPPRPSRSVSGTIAEPVANEAAPAASAAVPAAAPAVAATAAPAAAGKVLPVERLPPPAEKAAAKVEAKAPEKAVSKPVPKPEAKPEPKSESKAAAKVEPKVEAKPSATQPGRYVVQVGAYADEASAREARQKVERLGLKTYTQEVEVQGAKRIRVRVGPFDSAQEANKALATLKAGKLPGAVLTL